MQIASSTRQWLRNDWVRAWKMFLSAIACSRHSVSKTERNSQPCNSSGRVKKGSAAWDVSRKRRFHYATRPEPRQCFRSSRNRLFSRKSVVMLTRIVTWERFSLSWFFLWRIREVFFTSRDCLSWRKYRSMIKTPFSLHSEVSVNHQSKNGPLEKLFTAKGKGKGLKRRWYLT